MGKMSLTKVSALKLGLSKKVLTDTACAYEDKVPVMRLLGRVNDFQTGESTYGPWVKLKGRFEGINLLTGESIMGSEAHIPGGGGLNSQIAAILKETKKDDDTGEIEIGFDVYVLANSARDGYEYMVENVMPTDGVLDPMEDLKKKLPALPNQPKLATPEASEPETTTTEKKTGLFGKNKK